MEEFKWNHFLELLLGILKRLEAQEVKKDVPTALFLCAIILVCSTIIVLGLLLYGPRLMRMRGQPKEQGAKRSETSFSSNSYNTGDFADQKTTKTKIF